MPFLIILEPYIPSRRLYLFEHPECNVVQCSSLTTEMANRLLKMQLFIFGGFYQCAWTEHQFVGQSVSESHTFSGAIILSQE